jgi:hypothetical protein
MINPKPEIVADLENDADLTIFRTVRQYFEQRLRGISMVAMVQPGFLLEEVGAIMVDPEAREKDFEELLMKGAMQIIVPSRFGIQEPWLQYTNLLSEIRDDLDVFVVMIPPMYLAQTYEARKAVQRERASAPVS